MKKYRQFPLQREAITCYYQLTLFAVSKDEWDIKEDTGKFMKYALTYCSMPKGTSRAKVTSSNEKIKLVALAVIELHLSEGISQSVGQSVSRKFC